MIKRLELTDPNSCMSRAEDDEPTFVLLGRDIAASRTIAKWINVRIAEGKNTIHDPQIMEAIECAALMEEYREARMKREAGK